MHETKENESSPCKKMVDFWGHCRRRPMNSGSASIDRVHANGAINLWSCWALKREKRKTKQEINRHENLSAFVCVAEVKTEKNPRRHFSCEMTTGKGEMKRARYQHDTTLSFCIRRHHCLCQPANNSISLIKKQQHNRTTVKLITFASPLTRFEWWTLIEFFSIFFFCKAHMPHWMKIICSVAVAVDKWNCFPSARISVFNYPPMRVMSTAKAILERAEQFGLHPMFRLNNATQKCFLMKN